MSRFSATVLGLVLITGVGAIVFSAAAPAQTRQGEWEIRIVRLGGQRR